MQTFAVPEPQTPDELQVSPVVQALLSLQLDPVLAVPVAQTPVVELQMPTLWHWSTAVQMTGLEPVQVPLWHVSLWVQALLSSQVVLLGKVVAPPQSPVVVLQVPAEWHWSPAHVVTLPDPQTPAALQNSPVVHASPSVQDAPVAAGFEHTPLVVSQVPMLWH